MAPPPWPSSLPSASPLPLASASPSSLPAQSVPRLRLTNEREEQDRRQKGPAVKSARVKGLVPRPPRSRNGAASARSTKRPSWNVSPRIARNDLSQYLVGSSPCDEDYWQARTKSWRQEIGQKPQQPNARRKFAHDRSVRCLTLLWPSHLLSGCEGGVAALRRVSCMEGNPAAQSVACKTGQRVEAIYRGHTAAILHACALGASRFATASEDTTIRIWTRPSCRDESSDAGYKEFEETASSTLHGHAGPVVQLACAYFAGQLISASSDCDLRVWSLVDLSCQAILTGHFGGITHIQLVPRWGHAILAISPDGGVRVWRRPSSAESARAPRSLKALAAQAQNQELQVFVGQVDSFVSRVALSVNDEFLCAGCKNGELLIYRMAEQLGARGNGAESPIQLVHRFSESAEASAMDACCLTSARANEDRNVSSQVLIAGFRSGVLAVYNLSAGTCVRRIQAHRSWIMDITIHTTGSQRGPVLATCAFDGTLRVSSLALSDAFETQPHPVCAFKLATWAPPSHLPRYERTNISFFSCGADGQIVCTHPKTISSKHQQKKSMP